MRQVWLSHSQMPTVRVKIAGLGYGSWSRGCATLKVIRFSLAHPHRPTTTSVTVPLGFLADSVSWPSPLLANPTPVVSTSSVWTWAQWISPVNRAGQVGGAG